MKKVQVLMLGVAALLGMAEVAAASTLDTIHWIKAGDTLSEIAEDKCGRASLYPSLARENKISGPRYTIYTGRALKLTCERPVQVHKSETVTPVATGSGEVFSEGFEFGPALAPTTLVSIDPHRYEESMIEEVSVSTVTENLDIETVPGGFLSEGLYEIVMKGTVFQTGDYGARILLGQDAKGRWNRGETKVLVTRTANKDTLIRIFVKRDVEFSDPNEFALVFDPGGEAIIRLGFNDLVRQRVSTLKGRYVTKVEKEKYSALSVNYPQRPSLSSQIGKRVLHYTALAAWGYTNPIGAGIAVAVPVVKSFTDSKAQERIDQAAELLSAVN